MVLTDIILSLLKSNILMKEQEVMKSGFKKRLAALLSCALVLGMGMETSAAGTRVSDDGTMVSLVNGFRATGADCDQVGFMGPSQALAVDSYLTELAMQRAEERVPQPARGMPKSSRSPCRVPSSPFFP